MSNLIGKEYKCFEDIKPLRTDATEFWSARELAVVLDYTKWENFAKVIKRAQIACENSGRSVSDHFPEVRKMIQDLPTPEKSIAQLEKERLELLKKKAIEGK